MKLKWLPSLFSLRTVFECGCCFKPAISKLELVRCTKGHPFCRDCLKQYVLTCVEDHNAEVQCMGSGGCTASYSRSTLKKCVSKKILNLLEKIQQQKEILDAEIVLEGCPFCDFMCIWEGDLELFCCQNKKKCGVISCRKCKKMDHRPRNCRDLRQGRHFVEEEMTAAVIQWCPNCKKAIFRTDGCRYMICSYCRTDFCFDCGLRVSALNLQHYKLQYRDQAEPTFHLVLPPIPTT
ncbi:hypothetical protein BDQ17DRAFT_624755 [Cyathus striatus]|nr:hypothetical protein BDQ17DRAFT_624755 [Cyathus striatus]